MNTKIIIKHIASILTLIIALIFTLLKMCGVVITINAEELNGFISTLSFLISACIQLVPFIIQTIKDRDINKVSRIVISVINAVEEIKGLTSVQKKSKAMDIIIKECAEYGISVEVENIDNMIETFVALRNKVVK